jgi:hypothetical protein
MQELLKRRVITVTGMLLPSYAHDHRALERTLTAFGTRSRSSSTRTALTISIDTSS